MVSLQFLDNLFWNPSADFTEMVCTRFFWGGQKGKLWKIGWRLSIFHSGKDQIPKPYRQSWQGFIFKNSRRYINLRWAKLCSPKSRSGRVEESNCSPSPEKQRSAMLTSTTLPTLQCMSAQLMTKFHLQSQPINHANEILKKNKDISDTCLLYQWCDVSSNVWLVLS